MDIWKENEIKRYKDNVTYAYNEYLSSNSSKDWDKFWETFKIFLRETEYISEPFIRQNGPVYYLPFKEGQSILDVLNNIL